MFATALLSVATVTLQTPHPLLPTEKELKANNSAIVAFASKEMRSLPQDARPRFWPSELDESETYWKGQIPVAQWSADLRKIAFDSFVDKSRTDPQIRQWLLAGDAMTTSKLGFVLTCVLESRENHVSSSAAFSLVSRDSYQYDRSECAKVLQSLKDSQLRELSRGYLQIPAKRLSDAQRAMLAKVLPVPGTITPPEPEEGIVTIDLQYSATVTYKGKWMSVMFARPAHYN